MELNTKYAGQYYQMVNGDVYTQTEPGVFKYAGAVVGSTTTVQLTGYWVKSKAGNSMYQTTGGGWINLADGWQNAGYAPLRVESVKAAQGCVDAMIRNNAAIFENNLVCARFAYKLDEDQRWMLYELQSRLQSRNNQLLEDGLCSEQKVSTPPGYSLLNGYLADFMKDPLPVGVVISTTTLVVSAVVMASLAVAAYYAYRALYLESQDDVQYSKELTKTLMAKLTSEEYELLKKETQGIVTKSKLSAKLGSWMGVAKWGLLAAAGYVLYNEIKKHF